MTGNSPGLVSFGEAESMLGVSKRTLSRMVAQGSIEKVGRKLTRRSLDAFRGPTKFDDQLRAEIVALLNDIIDPDTANLHEQLDEAERVIQALRLNLAEARAMSFAAINSSD